MPRDMASLLSMPMTPAPPSEDVNASGQAQASGSLQQLMARGNAPAGAGGPPQLSYRETSAALYHMAEFQRRWKDLLGTEGIGKNSIKGPFIETVSGMMADSFITLPQAMSLLKSFPDDPLQQRQWVEQHYQNDKAAQIMLLRNHAASGQPSPSIDQVTQMVSQPKGGDHTGMMSGILDKFKGSTRKR